MTERFCQEAHYGVQLRTTITPIHPVHRPQHPGSNRVHPRLDILIDSDHSFYCRATPMGLGGNVQLRRTETDEPKLLNHLEGFGSKRRDSGVLPGQEVIRAYNNLGVMHCKEVFEHSGHSAPRTSRRFVDYETRKSQTRTS
jgi:hypothetical protein